MIPGFIVALLTFPGVIVHEIAHQLFCRWMRVAVLEVCYFRVGTPSGYVVHEIPRKASQTLMISIGPFLVNTLVGALIAMPVAMACFKFKNAGPLDFFLIWLGVSIAMHSFPSTGDAKSIWEAVRNRETSFLTKITATPVVALIYLGALGSVIWLDLFYGVAVAMVIPNLIIYFLA